MKSIPIRAKVLGYSALSFSLFALAGCGGSTSPTSSSVITLGSFTANIVGAAQTPVTIYSASGAVTGISGASFTDIANTDRFNVPVLYVSDEDGDDDIWAMTTTGALRTKLTNNSTNETGPALSPDGTRIAYASDVSGNLEIYTMNTDGTNVVQLTSSPSSDREPCWSPDGTKIAFSSARDGSFEIWTMNSSDGTGLVQVTNTGADTSATSQPQYSPDGTKIAYHANRLSIGNYECFVKNADGTGSEINLTNNTATDQYPHWSPDGSRMVIASQRSPSVGYDIWTINSATGGTPIQINSAAGTDWKPTFSPDGSKIYFSSFRDDLSAPITEEIYVVPTSGGTETRLTTDTDSSQDSAMLGSNWQTKLIGTNGRFGAGAAGFMFGQSASSTTSILTFDTVGSTLAGRAGARILANSPGDTSLSNFLFTITTSVGLSKINYTNSFGAVTLFPTIVNISIPAGSTNALVSYSGASTTAGQVVSVIPYTANRSATKTEQKGDVITVTGTFPAVYDASGQNIAPNGASTVRIHSVTGEVLSFE